jgi:hypothetical protein
MEFLYSIGELVRVMNTGWFTFIDWVENGGPEMGRWVNPDEILMVAFVARDGFVELIGTESQRIIVIPASKLQRI